MREFIPVGVTAMRDPMTGELLKEVPLYVEKNVEIPPPMSEAELKALKQSVLKNLRKYYQSNSGSTRKTRGGHAT